MSKGTTSETAKKAPVEGLYGAPILDWAKAIGCHVASLHRARMVGLKDPSGSIHFLKTTRVCGRFYLKKTDLDEFFELTQGRRPAVVQPARKPSQQAEAAEREADRIGF